MKKSSSRKLTLRTETVLHLQAMDLRRVNGGLSNKPNSEWDSACSAEDAFCYNTMVSACLVHG
ncbi:MAG TPA: hypothetical protein VH165_14685 [Kofleriaceae bacterium]|jgi:hypothetical protein|nr:hypothetical protein [Kofleriaceae bacterium]